MTAFHCWGSGHEEDRVIITDVEAIVLDTGKDYPDPAAAGEAHGVRFVSLLKISTDVGITGWSDIETQPHVGKAIVDAPSGGAVGFEGLRSALVGEDPLERERLWQKMYRYLAYYGRQGAGMQMISGADIALWDIAGKAFGQPVHKLLGAKYRDARYGLRLDPLPAHPRGHARGGGQLPGARISRHQVWMGRFRL